MEAWSTFKVFIAAFCAGALAGFATYIVSTKQKTPWLIVGHTLIAALSGCGLGMLGYEYLDGKAKPWRIIGCALLVGLGYVDRTALRKLVARILGIDKDGT